MLTFTSYGEEYRTHHSLLGAKMRTDPRVKDVHFISALDLNDPGKAFKDPEINPPRALQLAWDNQSEESLIGSLARVDFKSPEDAESVLKEWDERGLIWFAEPNYMSTLSDSSIGEGQNLGVFGNFKQKYEQAEIASTKWHKDIELLGAFEGLNKREQEGSPFDGSPPIIAIMDSGVDSDHPALQENMFENADPGETYCSGDDIHGCNTTTPRRGALGNGDIDPYGAGGKDKECPRQKGSSGDQCERNCCHGTHVAGIAVGKPTQVGSRWIAGVCPVCQIMALRVVGDNPDTLSGQKTGTILDSSIAGAFKYASQFRRCNGPDCAPLRVINASFGKFQRSRSIGVLVRAITDTPHNRGVLIVGAAGNEDSMRLQYPAGYSDAIAVANIAGRKEAKVRSSNFGRWVDVSAPGSDIFSSVPGPGDQGEVKTGTSMSSPVVAGIAGLLAIYNEDMPISEMRRRILEGADPTLYQNAINAEYIPSIPGEGNVPLLGSGAVNAANAVNNTATEGRPSVLALDRVEPGCGTVGDARLPSAWLLLLIPLLGYLQGLPPCRKLRGKSFEASQSL
jgi:subtilisin family serine protease